jgi:hypothetical protein
LPGLTVLQAIRQRLWHIFSPDYGTTWTTPEIAINAPAGSLPFGIVADDNWVHILAEPGVYVRRRVPPVFRSFRHSGRAVILEWAGKGTLQQSLEPNGPWEDLTNAISPQTVVADAATHFFRIKTP